MSNNNPTDNKLENAEFAEKTVNTAKTAVDTANTMLTNTKDAASTASNIGNAIANNKYVKQGFTAAKIVAPELAVAEQAAKAAMTNATKLADAANAAKDAINTAKDAIHPNINATKDAINTANDAIQPNINAAKDAINTAKDAMQPNIDAIQPNIDATKDAIQPNIDAAKDAIQPNINDAKDALLSGVTNSVEMVSSDAGMVDTVKILMDAATPLLAMSGVGIPLAAGLTILSKLIETFKADRRLSDIMTDCINIISNCYFLNKLITFTISSFKVVVDAKLEPAFQTKFHIVNLDKKIEERIILKLNRFNALLATITPYNEQKDTDGKTSHARSILRSLNKGMTRISTFINAKKYTEDIVRQLTIINSLFIVYNSQFDWMIAYYERMFNDNAEHLILQQIWTFIESRTEYNDYLNKPTGDEIKSKLDADIQYAMSKDKTIMSQIDEVVANATVQAATDVETDAKPIVGGRRTYKKYTRRLLTKPRTKRLLLSY